MQGDTEITNGQDVIDSRDVIARIEYIERSDCGGDEEFRAEGAAACDDEDCPTCNPDMRDELDRMRKFADEGANSAEDWDHGAALIRHDYAQDYAQQYAEDIGAIGNDAPWPANHIDWEAATEEFLTDYSEVDFDGVTYHVR